MLTRLSKFKTWQYTMYYNYNSRIIRKSNFINNPSLLMIKNKFLEQASSFNKYVLPRRESGITAFRSFPTNHEVPGSIPGYILGCFYCSELFHCIYGLWFLFQCLCRSFLSCVVFEGWFWSLQAIDQGMLSVWISVHTCDL